MRSLYSSMGLSIFVFMLSLLFTLIVESDGTAQIESPIDSPSSNALDLNRVEDAIEKALPLIAQGANGSADQRECFTCHNQGMPIMAMSAAKLRGFTIDQTTLDRQTKHTYEHLKRGLANYRSGKGQGGGVLTAGYALWALDEVDSKRDEVLETAANFLVDYQKEKKHWHHHSGRPPTSDSDFTATYVALRAIDHYATQADKDSFRDRKMEIAQWMRNNLGKDTEDYVFRLASLRYVDIDEVEIDASAARLLKLQHEDGGWGQLAESESDAYATATALYSLVQYGNVSPKSEPVQRGIEFLVNHQKDDGTWHVKTRAKPFQTYYESGFPHGVDQFLSIAASSWSVIAMTMVLDSQSEFTPSSAKAKATPVHSREANSKLAPFDREMGSFMEKFQVPGASLAVTYRGKLVYSQGFGFADLDAKEPVTRASLFRVASLSKPITGVAILKLVEEGKIRLEDRVLDRLNENSDRPWKPVDSRFSEVTIEQLLLHRGGWDRDQSFDPMFASVRFAEKLKIPSPPNSHQIIEAMMSEKLDFEPGARYAYSNFGYCLLGRIVERVSGQSYEEYVRSKVLGPLGIVGMRIGKTLSENRDPKEVKYYHLEKSPSVFAESLGKRVDSPYGGWHLEAMDSHGGWIASAEDLARFAMAFDEPEHSAVLSPSSIERMFAKPPEAPNDETKDTFYYSLGWMNRIQGRGKIDHWHTGSLPGTATILIRRHDGINMVALLNSREDRAKEPSKENRLSADLDRLLHRAANQIEDWSSIQEISFGR